MSDFTPKAPKSEKRSVVHEAGNCDECHQKNQGKRHYHFLMFRNAESLRRHLQNEYMVPLLHRHDKDKASAEKRNTERSAMERRIESHVDWFATTAPDYRDKCDDDGRPLSVADAWGAAHRAYTPKPSQPWDEPKTKKGRQETITTMIRLCGKNTSSPVSAGFLPVLKQIDLGALDDNDVWAECVGILRDFEQSAGEGFVNASVNIATTTPTNPDEEMTEEQIAERQRFLRHQKEQLGVTS